MAKAPEPAVAADQIFFELERFELSDGERLQLTGRWFGVRGRRFVRPTLTVAVNGERFRTLADLDDKPWAAEEGEPWTASFPWRKAAHGRKSELSVAPDITIQLPAPSAKLRGSQRLAAVPRRDAMTASWGELGVAVETGSVEQEEPAPEETVATSIAPPEPLTSPTEPPPRAPEPEPLRAEVDDLRAQLLEVTSELDGVRDRLRLSEGELESARAKLAAAEAAREAALRSAARAEAEREAALTGAEQAGAEREALAADNAQLTDALGRSEATVQRLTQERDEAIASRGAALVMRGATQALPAYERHVGWWRRGLAVLVLVGGVAAALIVLL
jgi:hypothetical protein